MCCSRQNRGCRSVEEDGLRLGAKLCLTLLDAMSEKSMRYCHSPAAVSARPSRTDIARDKQKTSQTNPSTNRGTDLSKSGKSAWDDLLRRREICSRCLTYQGMINRARICWGNEERQGATRVARMRGGRRDKDWGAGRPLRRSRAESLETDRNAALCKPTVAEERDRENKNGVREEIKPCPRE